VIAGKTVTKMTYNVSTGTLNHIKCYYNHSDIGKVVLVTTVCIAVQSMHCRKPMGRDRPRD